MQSTSTPLVCQKCGNPVSSSAAGLCPACLLFQGAQPDTLAGDGPAPFVPPSVEELASQFPKLEILELLGKGGMGAVYKARQKQLDRIVALKILPPGIGDDGAFAERFVREARALAKLNHPGIITIHEFGQAGDLFYFLMEFVDGMNLRQLLQAGRVPPREALAIVPQICDALQFAHDHGIVHRDIKPENILLDRKNRVKIADFGLVKLMDASKKATPEPGGAKEDLTQMGKTMGTPRYMAPEQLAQPEEVDHRADIYALGVVFYQMLTGGFPNIPVEPPSRKVSVDVRFDQVILRALEKRPELRFQRADEMKSRVERIARPSHRLALTWIFAGTLIGVGTYFAFRYDPKPLATPVPQTSTSGSQLSEQGWQLWQKGNFAEATPKFEEAVKLSPKDANAWNGLGWSLFNSGRSIEAEKPFREAIAIEPEHPGALNGLGQIYLTLGNFAEAEKYLLQAAPQAPAAWYGLARLYLLQERFADAATWATKILESGQGDPTIRQMLEAAQSSKLPDGLRILISPASYAKVFPATVAARTWLHQMDEGLYAQTWMEASPYVKGAVTQPAWIAAIAAARKPLGSLLSRRLDAFQSTRSLLGAPDGEYVVMIFHTELSGKKEAIETVTFSREQDGTWRASGYYIR